MATYLSQTVSAEGVAAYLEATGRADEIHEIVAVPVDEPPQRDMDDYAPDCNCTGELHFSDTDDTPRECEFSLRHGKGDGYHLPEVEFTTPAGFVLKATALHVTDGARVVTCDGEIIGCLEIRWAKPSIWGDYKWLNHYETYALVSDGRYKHFVSIGDDINVEAAMRALYRKFFGLE